MKYEPSMHLACALALGACNDAPRAGASEGQDDQRMRETEQNSAETQQPFGPNSPGINTLGTGPTTQPAAGNTVPSAPGELGGGEPQGTPEPGASTTGSAATDTSRTAKPKDAGRPGSGTGQANATPAREPEPRQKP